MSQATREVLVNFGKYVCNFILRRNSWSDNNDVNIDKYDQELDYILGSAVEKERTRITRVISNMYPDKDSSDPGYLIQQLKRQVATEVTAEVLKKSFPLDSK